MTIIDDLIGRVAPSASGGGAGLPRPRAGAAMAPDPPLAFRLVGVSRTYLGAGPPVPALHPTDLEIPMGSYSAVVGASGSGKSTLLNLLGLLDRPDTGTVEVCGVDSTTISRTQRSALRAREIGFVFQAFHLLSGRSVSENVELGLLYSGRPRRERRARASEVLDRVGLGHRRHADVRTLSGGERQRVAIARAVVTDPRILLCDEPTGNLDRANGNTVLALLRELHSAGTTVVVVTHGAVVAAAAERLLRVSDGAVTTDRALPVSGGLETPEGELPEPSRLGAGPAPEVAG